MMSLAWLGLALGVTAAVAGSSGGRTRDDAVRRARAFLARELNTPEARIVVRSAEPTEWPDASLGCPEEGMFYAQVLTKGYRVLATVAGREYEVHVAGGRAVLCRPERGSLKAGAAARSLEIERATDRARADLAQRLGIDSRAVKVKVVRDLGASGEGCPSPPGGAAGGNEASPPPGEAEGQGGSHEIELTAEGRTYRYEARRGRVTYCGLSTSQR